MRKQYTQAQKKRLAQYTQAQKERLAQIQNFTPEEYIEDMKCSFVSTMLNAFKLLYKRFGIHMITIGYREGSGICYVLSEDKDGAEWNRKFYTGTWDDE